MVGEEYYEFYLSKHQNIWSRRLHFLGQVFTLIYILWVLAFCSWWWLVLAPFVIYPTAFAGHIIFEKKMPALFTINFFRAKWCDLRMCWDMITGKLPF